MENQEDKKIPPQSQGALEQNSAQEDAGNFPYQGDRELRRHLFRAEEALLSNKIAVAREIFIQLSRDYPECGEAWLGLAKLDFLAGEFKDCAVNYRKALERRPTLGVFLKVFHMSPDIPDKLFQIASALYDEGMYVESLKFTDKLVEMKLPEEMRSKLLNLRTKLKSKVEEIHTEKTDASFEQKGHTIRSVIKYLGVVLGVAALIGIILFVYYSNRKSFETGLEMYQKALKEKEMYETTERNGSEAWKEFRKTEKFFRKLAEQNKSTRADFYLAKIYMDMHDLKGKLQTPPMNDDNFNQDFIQKARNQLKAVLKKKPDHPEALIEMARLYYYSGKNKKSLEYIDRADGAISGIKDAFKTRKESLKKQASQLRYQVMRMLEREKDLERKKMKIKEGGGQQ